MRNRAIGIQFRCQCPPETLQAFARLTEASGFDELWIVEDCFWGGGIRVGHGGAMRHGAQSLLAWVLCLPLLDTLRLRRWKCLPLRGCSRNDFTLD